MMCFVTNYMAYTGTEPDGGTGYVTSDEPESESFIKRQISKVMEKINKGEN